VTQRNVTGQKRRNSSGYIEIRVPDHPYARARGWVAEHRLVIEAQINRFLQPGEVVHHINGIKDDNRPENLMLFASNREHMAFERTHCKHGHQLEGDNVAIRDDGHGYKYRQCRICERAKHQRWDVKNRDKKRIYNAKRSRTAA